MLAGEFNQKAIELPEGKLGTPYPKPRLRLNSRKPSNSPARRPWNVSVSQTAAYEWPQVRRRPENFANLLANGSNHVLRFVAE
jgi:hypothetical protein